MIKVEKYISEPHELDGIYFGQLEPEEQELCLEAQERGEINIVYEGVMGMMGLGIIRVIKERNGNNIEEA